MKLRQIILINVEIYICITKLSNNILRYEYMEGIGKNNDSSLYCIEELDYYEKEVYLTDVWDVSRCPQNVKLNV